MMLESLCDPACFWKQKEEGGKRKEERGKRKEEGRKEGIDGVMYVLFCVCVSE